MSLAVLLRNCPHNGTATNGTTHIRYALKCDNLAVQIAKTPIQIPIPEQSPELIDIGIFRPSISISGVIDNLGQDQTTTGGDHNDIYENMERFTLTRHYDDASSVTDNQAATYYIPYKNALEEFIYKQTLATDNILELEIGDAEFPRYNRSSLGTADSGDETGGGLYYVSIQQARFQVDAAKEDRWEFQMQFVSEARADVFN